MFLVSSEREESLCSDSFQPVAKSTKTATHIIQSRLFLRTLENYLSLVTLHKIAKPLPIIRKFSVEKSSQVRNPRSLLHIVSNDHDRILLLEFPHQLLNLNRRNRVKRSARFIH